MHPRRAAAARSPGVRSALHARALCVRKPSSDPGCGAGGEEGGTPPAQTWPPLCAVIRVPVPVLSRVARVIFPPCAACGTPLPLSGRVGSVTACFMSRRLCTRTMTRPRKNTFRSSCPTQTMPAVSCAWLDMSSARCVPAWPPRHMFAFVLSLCHAASCFSFWQLEAAPGSRNDRSGSQMSRSTPASRTTTSHRRIWKTARSSELETLTTSTCLHTVFPASSRPCSPNC